MRRPPRPLTRTVKRSKHLEPTTRVTEYVVSCLPPDHEEARNFTLYVRWRGGGLWCVSDGPYCYTRTGRRSYERGPSSRTAGWLKFYRFDLQTALELAERLAPKMRCNGFTVSDVMIADSGDGQEKTGT